MRLTVQKRLAASILGVSQKKVVFDEASLEVIKEAITTQDIRSLINSGIITKKQTAYQSKVRARAIKAQKSKGRQRGAGSRRGTAHARLSTKDVWMAKVRLQRALIKELRDKEKLTVKDYRMLYQRVKGGVFRNKRHLKLFIDEKGLVK
ncbi:MAG: 50S ribosomal protein L19e [Candidatus Woesearchaeota archaeon]